MSLFFHSYSLPGSIDERCLIRYPVSMDAHRILIAGDALFAETLAGLLRRNSAIEVIGIAPDLDGAQRLIDSLCPDALIYAIQTDERDDILSKFLNNNPNLSIVSTDPRTNAIRVIISQQISVHSSTDLLVAIAALPKRS